MYRWWGFWFFSKASPCASGANALGLASPPPSSFRLGVRLLALVWRTHHIHTWPPTPPAPLSTTTNKHCTTTCCTKSTKKNISLEAEEGLIHPPAPKLIILFSSSYDTGETKKSFLECFRWNIYPQNPIIRFGFCQISILSDLVV